MLTFVEISQELTFISLCSMNIDLNIVCSSTCQSFTVTLIVAASQYQTTHPPSLLAKWQIHGLHSGWLKLAELNVNLRLNGKVTLFSLLLQPCVL